MKQVIIDTDPGIDDALALMYALNQPQLEVVGITTVAGNVSVDKGTRNALSLLNEIGRAEVSVAVGATRPLARKLVSAEAFHGEDGLANLNLPEPPVHALEEGAVEWMRQTILSSDKPLKVLALGPLTNLALLAIQYPRAYQKIDEIIFMGGAAFCGGNVTPKAEFNIHADPEAAQVVLTSGVPLTMVGLDVTMQVIFSREHLPGIKQQRGATSRFAYRLLDQAFRVIPGKAEKGGCALHDPLTIAQVLHPSWLTLKEYPVAIETSNGICLGQTVVDERPYSTTKSNVKVAVAVDSDAFVADFVSTISHN